MPLTLGHITQAYVRLRLNNVARPQGRERISDQDLDAEQREYLLLLDGLEPEDLNRAVTLYLQNPQTCRWWPRAAELRDLALKCSETTPTPDRLDPDAAYRIARDYVAKRTVYFWPGASLLRAELQRRQITGRVLQQRLFDADEEYVGNMLGQILRGDVCPDRTILRGLAKVLGAQVVDAAHVRSPWADLQDEAAIIAGAAQVAGTWAEWVELRTDEVPSHRKAFRDAFDAARKRADEAGAVARAVARVLAKDSGRPMLPAAALLLLPAPPPVAEEFTAQRVGAPVARRESR